MSLWSRLFGGSYNPAQYVQPVPYEPFISTGGIPVADPGSPLEAMLGERSQVEVFWRDQPNLRKVVDFIARNIASTRLHLYERVSGTDRARVTDHVLARTLASPQPGVSPYRFWHGVLSDGLLYDRWCVLKMVRPDGGLDLVQVPSWRLRIETDPLRRVVGLWYWMGDRTDGGEDWERVPLDEAIFDHGYAPRTAGMTPVRTLRDILDESAEAVRYRRDVWENGARAPGYVSRPKDAGSWTEEQRSRFVEAMRSVYGKDGSNAGGMPLFEDGMEMRKADIFSPQAAADLEGRRLSGAEVAAAFHIAPELVGSQQGNYSNVDAFRQMLYGPSLGPYIDAWEGVLNAQLTPDFAEDGRPLYIEANVESKLRGSFLEQAQVMQSATGAPWLLRNEARAKMNLPALDGADDLVVPLNVLTGGQASPRDSGSQNSGPKSYAEARKILDDSLRDIPSFRTKERPERHEDKALEVLVAFFKRQRVAVSSAVGAGADEWWDGERWDRELSDDLLKLSVLTSSTAATKALEGAGLDPDEYDVDRTLAYLRKAADSNAENINALTRDHVKKSIEDGGDVGEAFDQAEGQRAEAAAGSLTTFAAGFGVVESARQTSTGATKTWIVTSGNPRASHAAMDGETVPVDELFSNGLLWPGSIGDPDEVAGCMCEVQINY